MPTTFTQARRLNPFIFRAGVQAELVATYVSGKRLNPFIFRAGVQAWPSGRVFPQAQVLIPLSSGLVFRRKWLPGGCRHSES